MEDIRAELAREVALGILIPLLLALPLLALLVWLVVAWATRSLVRASLEIEQRDPDRLTPIGIERVPREIQGVVRAVNGLLQRLDQTLSRERRFTADAAHELRTPIAARACRQPEDSARRNRTRRVATTSGRECAAD